MSFLRRAVLVLALVGVSAPAHAGALASGWTPRVPASGLAFPTAWFDPSRLHVSTSLTVGSGGFGGTSALQVTSLSYQIATPLHLGVSLGNSWGGSRYASNGMFLEGLDLSYHPSANFLFQVQYRDVRSPLQWSQGAFAPSHFTPLP